MMSIQERRRNLRIEDLGNKKIYPAFVVFLFTLWLPNIAKPTKYLLDFDDSLFYILKGNKKFRLWRHFTTTTRVLFVNAFVRLIN